MIGVDSRLVFPYSLCAFSMVCYKEMTRMKRTLLLVFGFYSINVAQQLRVEKDAIVREDGEDRTTRLLSRLEGR